MQALLQLAVAAALVQGPLQHPDLPPPISAGLRALSAGRCSEAFIAWSKDWNSPEDVGKQQQLRTSCDVLARFGKFHGYDVLSVVDVGPHVRRVYVVLRYEIQPVYMMLIAYRPAEAWKVNTVNWNTIPDKVLPASVAPLERPQP